MHIFDKMAFLRATARNVQIRIVAQVKYRDQGTERKTRRDETTQYCHGTIPENELYR
jgi:hypothetical protein